MPMGLNAHLSIKDCTLSSCQINNLIIECIKIISDLIIYEYSKESHQCHPSG